MIYISQIIVGLDEAGRGPVLGPLVICAYAIKEEKEEKLVELGVKDSKILSKNKREELYPQLVEIAECYKTKHISASEIDDLRKRYSLNVIEQTVMLELASALPTKPHKIVIDAADVNEDRFGQVFVKTFKNCEIISKHSADIEFPVVSAASIIAKVQRDKAILEIGEQFGEIGSGYPSDPKTKLFLEQYFIKNQNFPHVVRKSWKTAIKIKAKYKIRTKLDEFL